MKKLFILFFLSTNLCYSQWNTSGANIYNVNSGNVGIGTSSPTKKLDINGTLGLSNQLTQNYSGLNYNYNAKFNGIILQSPQQDNFILAENALYDGQLTDNSQYAFNGPAAAMQISQGRFFFYTGSSGTAGSIIPNWAFLPKIGISNQGGFAIGSSYAVSSTNGDGVLTVSNKVGIGTALPTEQLHSTGSVRFQGLTTGGTVTNLIGIDAHGKLWKTSLATGLQSTCNTVNIIPKISATNQVSCSMIFDNGTSVGINKTSGFGYTSGAILSNGSPTPPSTFTLAVNGWTSSTAFVALSDKSFKKDIHKLKSALEKTLKLNGVTYLWDEKRDINKKLNNNREIGFLAQDVEAILPEAVIKTDDNVYGLNYNAIIPVLAEAIKELNDKIVSIEKKSEELMIENTDLKKAIADIYETLLKNTTIENKITKSENKLLKNIPNPPLSSTSIEYLWQTGQFAYIVLNSIDGRLIQKISLSKKGKNTIPLNTSGLTSGIYLYQLFIDNKLIDSKQMIIAK
jgi:hypothetical protein